ncbi:MAG: type VI secretion system baseplate subunit TssF [Lamprobacter sp.]|uniref:type VI secretion system baseplate subunit TssF n=1 Tax=Lamprobacter sp. TaxID=3100796 RepID=UPI002B262F53|nr:type VI secretion system baseplate subunit TssF [Lamprobacter sp.]MEA3640534.1 type VI secretion system baseplate subunit TssF [Lamprobacter sp.]
MDARFLDLYNRELRYIREMSGEFAAQFPKVASRLGLDSFECADPYVERLLEGFAFLAARVGLKLEAEFPQFTRHLIEVVYPHFLAPTPSMAVVEFIPDATEGSLSEGFQVPSGTQLRSVLRKGETTPCTYTTGHDLTLWPLQVERAEYIGSASLLPEVTVPGQGAPRAGVRLRLSMAGHGKISDLALDELDVHLAGQDALPMRLYEYLAARTVGVAARPATSTKKSDWLVSEQSKLKPLGFSPTQALLPVEARAFDGYRLLHEYFSFPQRFMFLRVSGLKRLIRRTTDKAIDLVFLFDRADPALEQGVSGSMFRLNATPLVNLFPKRMDRIHLNNADREFHLVAERTRPMDFEVFAVNTVNGYGRAKDAEREFLPFYSARHRTFHAQPNAYFSLRREQRLLSSRRQQRNIGPRSSYIGSEAFISLVDPNSAPFSSDLKQLGVEALCTNRDLPLLLSLGSGSTDFTWDFSGPVEATRCIAGPSRPRPSPLAGEQHWRLISHLSLNYLSLNDTEGGSGTQAFQELLGLYAFLNEAQIRKEIEGIRDLQTKPIHRRVSHPQGSTFVRGLEVSLLFDETLFEGTGCFLLGTVLEQFLSRHVAINSFTETVIKTIERGEIMRWPRRVGRRQIL